MDSARIRELLEPFLSTPANGQRPTTNDVPSSLQLQNISTYIDLLLHWNARINLTAVRHPEEIVTRHFGESLFAARHLFPRGFDLDGLANDQRRTTNDVLDVGSGAGFPGLPVKIWMPPLRVTLIESNQKKATFLREVVRILNLADVDVFADRAEDFSAPAEIVTLRAVEHFERILPIAARLVAPEGRLVLLIGQTQVNPTRSMTPDFHWNEPVPIPLAANRMLLIGTRQRSDSR